MKKMVYGALLASGKGTRMKDNVDLPKQFRLLNGIPVIIYTLKNMLKVSEFDMIYLAVSECYLQYMKVILETYTKESYLTVEESAKVHVVTGGESRMDTINNVIDAIYQEQEVTNEDIIVIHDGVRPFVSSKILTDSIKGAREYGAVVAAVPVADTLLISDDGLLVDDIPKRSLYYKGQAPDSFRLSLFKDLLSKLSESDRLKITGTSQVCTLNHYPIHIIEGDDMNFKITSASDLKIASIIASEEGIHD